MNLQHISYFPSSELLHPHKLGNGGAGRYSRRVPSPKPNIFWPLRLIAVLSLVAPALLFSYSTWQNHRAINAQAEERIERGLDVVQEHALKALQTVERSISEVNEVVRGLSDQQIRANEADLFLRLKRTQQALPQIESIWIFDRNGHPLVSSTIFPVPPDLNNSDRSYFVAQQEKDAGTYISEVVKARVGSLSFFVVSGRREAGAAGTFDGVIGVTVMPAHFSEFYRKLARGDDAFTLVKNDGRPLARFPEIRLENVSIGDFFSDAIVNSPERGQFTAISSLDGIEWRVGYRQVPGFPLYALASIETAALTREFRNLVVTQFALGLPAVMATFALALYALRRAQRLQEEEVRREVAENALKQAQRLEAIGQLTGGIAHDFNNLLMVVDGNVQRIKRAVVSDERLRRSIAAIETAVNRGTSLTRQLLSFSRKQTHEARPIDLGERLPAVQGMLQSSLRGDIFVEIAVSEGLWPTRIDPNEFELALLNLAVNARDAMRSGGTLTIAARNIVLKRPNPAGLEGDYVRVSVTDTGEGIPPEVLPRVFEPFFTTKDVGKGTGLGLSQVFGFARQAGGNAVVESSPGNGTVVTLYLPRTHSVPEAASAGSSQVPPTSSRANGQVLIVEDNAEVADVIRALLEEAGYSVLAAHDVASALSILGTRIQTLDFVLTDIVMPGGSSGIALARWIREKHPSLPVVLATGYSASAQAAADEGFTILRKPFTMAELVEAIAKHRTRFTSSTAARSV